MAELKPHVRSVEGNYDLTEITRIMLKMRDNCVRKEDEAYDDPERKEKCEALEAAIDLINNPSMLLKSPRKENEAAEVVKNGRWIDSKGAIRCSECMNEPLYDYHGRLKLSMACPTCGAKMWKEK